MCLDALMAKQQLAAASSSLAAASTALKAGGNTQDSTNATAAGESQAGGVHGGLSPGPLFAAATSVSVAAAAAETTARHARQTMEQTSQQHEVLTSQLQDTQQACQQVSTTAAWLSKWTCFCLDTN